MNDEKILKINKRSFIIVSTILIAILILTYILTFVMKKGIYIDGIYQEIAGKGYSFTRFLITPLELLVSEDNLTIIVISLFIVVLGGAFNAIDKTNGIKSIIGYLIAKYQNKKYLLLYLITLFFMLFGALFGIFEESVTLLPIIVLLAIYMGWDTFTGLGMCLMAAGFGFSTAITNPFSVGLGASEMELNVTDGILYRIFIFIIMYLILCLFLTLHAKKIEKDPKKSPTYENDQRKKSQLNLFDTIGNNNSKTLRTYTFFFTSLLIIIILSSIIPFTQENGLSIPIIALTFLLGIFICGKILGYKLKEIGKYFLSGALAMSPAVILILLAGSVKLILINGQIMHTIIYSLTNMLSNTSPFVGVLFIYLIILLIQLFIGSASAKVVLIIPIIKILSDNLGISRNLALLAFIFGDGYTDLLYPTNPVLLISLGMVSFSYSKWIKKTAILQLIILIITILFLVIGYLYGY